MHTLTVVQNHSFSQYQYLYKHVHIYIGFDVQRNIYNQSRVIQKVAVIFDLRPAGIITFRYRSGILDAQSEYPKTVNLPQRTKSTSINITCI